MPPVQGPAIARGFSISLFGGSSAGQQGVGKTTCPVERLERQMIHQNAVRVAFPAIATEAVPLLMLGDCLERMAEITDGSIDLTVTSPPYDNLRTYNGTLNDWTPEKAQGCSADVRSHPRLALSSGQQWR